MRRILRVADLQDLHAPLNAPEKRVALVTVKIVAGDRAQDVGDLSDLAGVLVGELVGPGVLQQPDIRDVQRDLVRDLIGRKQQVDDPGRPRRALLVRFVRPRRLFRDGRPPNFLVAVTPAVRSLPSPDSSTTTARSCACSASEISMVSIVPR